MELLEMPYASSSQYWSPAAGMSQFLLRLDTSAHFSSACNYLGDQMGDRYDDSRRAQFVPWGAVMMNEVLPHRPYDISELISMSRIVIGIFEQPSEFHQ